MYLIETNLEYATFFSSIKKWHILNLVYNPSLMYLIETNLEYATFFNENLMIN